jgi:hypothetical protein
MMYAIELPAVRTGPILIPLYVLESACSMSVKPLILSLLTLAALSTNVANANLITNGGFEAVTNGTNKQLTSGKTTTLTNRTTLTGWNSAPSNTGDGGYNFVLSNASAGTSTSIKQLKNYTASANGGNVFASDAQYGPGLLSQTINDLSVGASYLLTFDSAVGQQAGFSGANLNNFWQVSFGDTTLNTAALTIADGEFSGWKTASMAFTATSASQMLSFLAKGGSAGAPPFLLLDGVSMNANANANTSAVPEPSTISLLLGGIGLAGFLARRRRNHKS